MTTDTRLSGTLFVDEQWDEEALGEEAFRARQAFFAVRYGPGWPTLTWVTAPEDMRAQYRAVAIALAARIAREPAWRVGAGVMERLEGNDDAG